MQQNHQLRMISMKEVLEDKSLSEGIKYEIVLWENRKIRQPEKYILTGRQH